MSVAMPQRISPRNAISGLDHSTGAWTMLVALVVIALPFFMLAVFGGEAVEQLRILSAKFEALRGGSELVIALLAVAAIAATGVGAWLLAAKKNGFVVVLILSVAFSEVTVSVLNQAAFGIRYLLFLIVTALGLVQLTRWNKAVVDSTVAAGMMLLAWIAIVLVIAGADAEALAMLPVQVTLLIGILAGLKSRFVQSEDIRDLCVVFGWIGAAATVIHVAAAMAHDAPFLGGRFRSIYPLPTNFANAYVLLFIAMIWLLFHERRVALKGLLLVLVGAGALLIFLAGTRNAMLSAAIAVLIFALVWRTRILAYGAVVVLLAGIVVSGFLAESGNMSWLSHRLSSSDTVRWEVWERALSHIQQHPIAGFGLGVTMNELDTRLPVWERFDTHNAYLGIWLQIGVVGLAFIVAMYGIALYSAFVTLRNPRLDPALREIMILPATLLVVLLVAGMFEENLTSRGSLQQILWALCIALVMNIKVIARAAPPVARPARL